MAHVRVCSHEEQCCTRGVVCILATASEPRARKDIKRDAFLETDVRYEGIGVDYGYRMEGQNYVVLLPRSLLVRKARCRIVDSGMLGSHN